ncbi:lipoprotein-releasing ABC transporter permease subunit [Dasania sp. GY-MA-18]|uniref:Lipoprotein-releasing ABC transporter permease subunit n=1 Tax=Dasania phycosphaerae TaxID=2950436 RepID=A0A9J6RJE6_9GAMM|nr:MULTISPECIES: lipoprotein-releasing ABC transporter permease subunit [Dasania]MCR8921899.1 lipoprotein-releasing ABC transporter permease subunit [Dasania sp. GY-MA-18]MCZ0864327.1 lipoprotein-releasing ABC transporter permease subunit [Dasania phycosphaerae]MCZ0868055.1 lipoprotein-releasing ABC transporter permease subunit [Dasania phycosphaerae]
MFKPCSFFIGLRYAGAKRRSQLVSFISLVSMLGMTVGVALLIVVLSVMNGFDKEMRERILGLVPHITISSHGEHSDWPAVESIIRQHPQVAAAAPFVQLGGMLLHGTDVESVMIYGIDVKREAQVSIIDQFIQPQALQQLDQQADSVIIGRALAQRLNLHSGDHVNIMIPQQSAQGKTQPIFKRLQLLEQFNTGTELDQSVILLSLASAQPLLAGNPSAQGLRLLLHNTFSAPRVAWEIEQNLPYGYSSRDWTRSHGNLYSAIQLSKQLVGLMLFIIIAVAAFNVVSALVMVVTDKQGDIAILRTLGASPRQVMMIFVVQGSLIGLVGTVFGVLLGLGLSASVGDMVAGLEQLLQYQFLNSDVYPVDYLPVDMRWWDVSLVAGTAFTMSILATIYPAWRAAKVRPAEALRYE